MPDKHSPDWVVLGSPSRDPQGRFVLYASRDLRDPSTFDTKTIAEYNDDWTLRSYDTWNEIHLKMGTVYMVFGDSYGECWQRLFQVWSPETGPTQQPELSNRREIEP